MTQTTETSLSTKDKVEALMKLADNYWKDFDHRRSYEWKANFALWAAFGALTGFLAKGELELSLFSKLIFTAVVFGIFLVYWLTWSTGMWIRNFRNLKDAYDDWNAVRVMLHQPIHSTTVDAPSPPDWVQRSFPKWTHDRIAIWKDWSRSSQLGITFLFCIASWTAIWF